METLLYYLEPNSLILINMTNNYFNTITNSQEFWLNKLNQHFKFQKSFYAYIKLYQTILFSQNYAKDVLAFTKSVNERKEFLIKPSTKLRLQPIPDFILKKLTFTFNPDDECSFHFKFSNQNSYQIVLWYHIQHKYSRRVEFSPSFLINYLEAYEFVSRMIIHYNADIITDLNYVSKRCKF